MILIGGIASYDTYLCIKSCFVSALTVRGEWLGEQKSLWTYLRLQISYEWNTLYTQLLLQVSRGIMCHAA